jgi:hypothetical protein
MAPLIEARSQLAAKVEDVDMEELNLQSSSLSPFPAVAGGGFARMTFETPLKGSGVAGTPPEISALFRACGLCETTVGGTSVTYAPASAVSLRLSGDIRIQLKAEITLSADEIEVFDL